MSLKHFHIAFIFFCAFFAFMFAAWCLLSVGLPVMFRVMGGLSATGGVALVIYGIRFYRKSKNVII